MSNPPSSTAAPMYLPQGYKQSTRETVERTKYGRNVKHVDHWDGSKDAVVRVKSLRLNLTAGAPPRRHLLEAVAELQEANREYRLAKASEDAGWVAYATARLRRANQRLVEVQ